MLVYGDPSYEEELGVLVARLRARVANAARAQASVTRDMLRTLLIEAGQVEQAVWDSLGDVPAEEAARLGPLCQTVTDQLAAAFSAHWVADGDDWHAASDVPTCLDNALDMLDNFAPASDVRVLVKLPEGYAFYHLYPEQYALAARGWAAEHAGESPRTVLVVGVRSIGTSLSALVAAVLRTEDWQAERLTVRPAGHPFDRHTAIRALAEPRADWALVVDEGPGQSGSSLASVAQALVEAGMEGSRLCFFPGHGGQPGVMASDAVRMWWARAPRQVVSPDDLRWAGQSWADFLAARTQAVIGSGASVVRVDDFGGGLWRRFVYAEPAQWPASCLPFERPKYRCVLSSGASVLWTYAGLAVGPNGPQTDAAFARQQTRAVTGWTAAPLATVAGFVATPWVDGQPLSASDAQNASVMAHMGRYIAGVAGPPLSEGARVRAVRRLEEMLGYNVREAWGDDAAARTQPWSQAAVLWASRHAAPTYGDGRMAPHEWLRTPSGLLIKTDGGGHDADHTLIGRQSVAWDIAGAMVEWELDESAAQTLRQALEGAGGALVTPDVLQFHCLAYAAFRMGQCALCADMLAHDPPEQVRLRAASARYQAQLMGLLG